MPPLWILTLLFPLMLPLINFQFSINCDVTYSTPRPCPRYLGQGMFLWKCISVIKRCYWQCFGSQPLTNLSVNIGYSSVVCVCLCECLVAQWCPTLCDPIDCSPPGSSVHGISQARILEWVTISSSRGSSWPRDRTCFSHVSCISRQILYHCTTWEALPNVSYK